MGLEKLMLELIDNDNLASVVETKLTQLKNSGYSEDILVKVYDKILSDKKLYKKIRINENKSQITVHVHKKTTLEGFTEVVNSFIEEIDASFDSKYAFNMIKHKDKIIIRLRRLLKEGKE